MEALEKTAYNPMISVIIPVYNAEQYISECLDSVLAQTLQDYEIICVDDGSTDRSYDIICEYMRDDNRIRVIQQQNQYAGVARNNGIAVSRGKYLYFLDADDFIAPGLMEKTCAKAEEAQADIIVFDGFRYDTNTKEISDKAAWLDTNAVGDKQVFSRKDCPGDILTFSNPAPWTKLYRKEFVVRNNLKYQALPSANDVLFTKLAFAVADRIAYIEDRLVYYRYGMEANTQNRKNKYGFSFMLALKELRAELMKRNLFDQVDDSYRAFFINTLHYELFPYRFSGDKAQACESIYGDPITEEILASDNMFLNCSKKDVIRRKADDLRKWEVAFNFTGDSSRQGEVNRCYTTFKKLLDDYNANCETVNWFLQHSTINQQIISSLNETRAAYRNLPSEEQLFYLGYDKQEWPIFERLIVDFVQKENVLQDTNDRLTLTKADLKKTKKELKTTQKKLEKTQQKLEIEKQKLEKLKNSRSYKIGRAVTWVPRRIKSN